MKSILDILNYLSPFIPFMTALASVSLAVLTWLYIRELKRQSRESIKPNLQITAEISKIYLGLPDAGSVEYLGIIFTNTGKGPCCSVLIKVEIYSENDFDQRKTIYEKFIPYPIPSNQFARLDVKVSEFINWAEPAIKKLSKDLIEKGESAKLSSLILKFTIQYTDLKSEGRYEKNLFLKYSFEGSKFEFKTKENTPWKEISFNPNPHLSNLFQDYIPLNLYELKDLS